MGTKEKLIISLGILTLMLGGGVYFFMQDASKEASESSVSEIEQPSMNGAKEIENLNEAIEKNQSALDGQDLEMDEPLFPENEIAKKKDTDSISLGERIKTFLGFGGDDSSDQTRDSSSLYEPGTNQAKSAPSGTIPGNESSSLNQKQEAKKAAIKPGCYKVTYQRSKNSKKLDWQEYAKLQNVITLDDTHIKPRSICVKVNDVPVNHQLVRHPSKENLINVVVQGQAGPHAEITTSYCVGEVKCKEKCDVPKDEFMTALGLEDTGAQAAPYEAWGDKTKNDPSKAEKDLDKEYQVFAKEMNETLSKHGPVYKDWKKAGKGDSCQSTGQAKLPNGKKKASLMIFKRKG